MWNARRSGRPTTSSAIPSPFKILQIADTRRAAALAGSLMMEQAVDALLADKEQELPPVGPERRPDRKLKLPHLASHPRSDRLAPTAHRLVGNPRLVEGLIQGFNAAAGIQRNPG